MAHADHRHGVVFYEDDRRFLGEAILDFCIRALRAGDPLVLIATREHLAQMRSRLRDRGYDWDAACRLGLAAGHDAEDVLERVCTPQGPDAARFRAAMEEVLAPWAGVSPDRTVRTFGEMVDLLSRRGDLEGAARLEEMWNDLARSHRFTLLCAYAMGNLYREVNGGGYRRIVDAHDHVLPDSLGDDGTALAL